MPVYTYLMQVLPKGGESWANLLEPRTGAPMDGTFGAVDVPESGLPGAAREIMKRYSGITLRRRVAFWEDRRVNDKLYTSEVFCMVYDDGVIVGAETIRQDAGAVSARHSADLRPGCPYAPHDGSCGHSGACMFAHRGRDCDAVRPVCPACFDEERPVTVPDIVARIQRDGELVLRCSSCEQLSFRFDAELVCNTCQWLVPHANDELEERFTAYGGGFPPQPGSCPGCGDQMPHLPGPFSFGCPRCGQNVNLDLGSLTPRQTVTTMCPNKECGHYIAIPPSIWCPVCGQNLRPLNVIRKLTLEANDVRVVTSSNARDDEATHLARRLAVAAESSTRTYTYLSDERKKLLMNRRYLDSVAFSAETPDEWIRDVAEIRVIGHELNRRGGMRAMREVHQRVMELGRDYRGAARHVELYWDQIGDWRG